jgi:drug/metabolite transporter (DMT)-like permease
MINNPSSIAFDAEQHARNNRFRPIRGLIRSFRSQKTTRRASMALIAATAIWGGTVVVAKVLLEGLPALSLVGIRFLLATLFLLPGLYRFFKNNKLRDYFVVATIGIFCNALPVALIFISLDHISATEYGIVSSLGPIIMFMLSLFILKEQMRKRVMVGLAVAALGATYVAFFGSPGGLTGDVILGSTLLIAALITDNLGTILTKKYSKHYDLSELLSARIFFAGIVFIPIMFVQFDNWSFGGANPVVFIGLIILMTLLNVVIAIKLLYFAIDNMTGEEASPYGYLQPVFAVLSAQIFLREMITIHQVLGAAIIASGVYFAENQARKPVHYRSWRERLSHQFKLLFVRL